MDRFSLAGKTVLITGGAVRVGRYLAIAAAQAGANVIIHYSHSEEQALHTQEAIQQMGVKCWTIQQDFAKTEEISEFMSRCWQINPVDVLVNNAAIFKSIRMENTSLRDWREHMAINMDAPFLLTQRFVQLGLPDRPGRVINLLDWRALRPGVDHFPYTISKAGLAALTQSIAAAAAPRVLVNGLALGAMLAPAGGVDEKALFSDYPIKRWIDPEELTQSFLFLAAGPEIITGEIIHLDGGRHLT